MLSSNVSPEIILTLTHLTGTPTVLSDCLSLHFEKEAYTPFTSLTATFLYEGEMIKSVSDVSLSVGGTLIHKGFADTLKVMTYPKYKALTITSRGYTSLLGQTEIPEGLISNPSLDSVFEIVSDLPNINHTASSQTINYIYVKNHTSAWDVIVNLSIKVYARYPHILHDNTVSYIPPPSPKVVDPIGNKTLICKGSGLDYSNAVSDLYMLDTTGVYNYHVKDSTLTSLGIIRRKYLALDKHWLENPLGALYSRMSFGMRGSRYFYWSYRGYCGEDLMDAVNDDEEFLPRITKIVIDGNSRGLVTKLWGYDDRYITR